MPLVYEEVDEFRPVEVGTIIDFPWSETFSAPAKITKVTQRSLTERLVWARDCNPRVSEGTICIMQRLVPPLEKGGEWVGVTG